VRGVAATILVVGTLALFGAGAQAADPPPQVTVIGDSVLTGVLWNAQPLSILQHGLQMRLDIGVCRRLTGVSCPYEGGNVPTLLDVVNTLGPQLGKVVLVEVGYNDDHDTFAQNVELSINALLQAGVKRILWANLRGFAQQWLDMNAVLDAAARRHPELTVIDWNGYSDNKWSWFQGDGIHLVDDGAVAMATLFRSAIDEALVPPLVVHTTTLPVARVGHKYVARLVAAGGIKPYKWRVTSGSLPKGLSLRPNGQIDGVARRSGQVRIVVSATDSHGRAATRPELLKIASAK
jgi:hypothetical protein